MMYLWVWGRRKRFLASENERLTVFVCYHRAVRMGWTILDAYKSHIFGAVTFNKRVVCSFMFKNLSELKSGKECNGFTLVSGADFRRNDRCFIGFLLWSILCFFPLRRHDWLIRWLFLDVIQKFFGASSVESCCILEWVTSTFIVCITKISNR